MIQSRLLCSNLFHLRDIALLVAGVDSEGLLREPVIVFPGEHDNELALLLDTLALLPSPHRTPQPSHAPSEHDGHHHDEVGVVGRAGQEHARLQPRPVEQREQEEDEVVGERGEEGDSGAAVVEAREGEKEVSAEHEERLEGEQTQQQHEGAVLEEAVGEAATRWLRGVGVGVEAVAEHALQLHARLEDGVCR